MELEMNTKWGKVGLCFHRTVGGKAKNWSPAWRSLAPLWPNQASSGRVIESSSKILHCACRKRGKVERVQESERLTTSTPPHHRPQVYEIQRPTAPTDPACCKSQSHLQATPFNSGQLRQKLTSTHVHFVSHTLWLTLHPCIHVSWRFRPCLDCIFCS